MNDIIREFDPGIDDWPDQPFPFITTPCSVNIFWRHREIAQRLDLSGSVPLNPLWADATLLELVSEVLQIAFAIHSHPSKCRRKPSTNNHADRIEAAKLYLATRLGERTTLEDVATAAHTSPFHFARIFRQQTGVPLHRYQTHLRLRNSLERLADGGDDIALIALELGFSSHSHFTETFHREFGYTPSEIRRTASHRLLQQLSKNLKA